MKLTFSTSSLRVLMELPVVIVMLIQIHRSTSQDFFEELLPIICTVQSSLPIPQILTSQSYIDHQSYMHLPSFNSKKKLFIRYTSVKVKLLSFLAYLSRSYPKHIKNISDSFAKSVFQLFQQCPVEAVAVRKVKTSSCQLFRNL